jgi:DNA-binding CsgD family transcriptional regulator/PAS domain-containing protein
VATQDRLDAEAHRPAGIPNVDPGLEQFSELIGQIYDCALDPSRWQAVMGEICRQFGFDVSTLHVLRLPVGAPTIQAVFGIDREWVIRSLDYQADLVEAWGGAERLMSFPLDEPVILSRYSTASFRESTRYYREFAEPVDIHDSIAFAIARGPSMVGGISFNRRGTAMPFGDIDVEHLRLIAPHVRRAVTISDLFGVRAVEAATFGSILDTFPFGVLLVDRELAIVHANAAAAEMLNRREPIRSEKGRVALTDRTTQGALERAVQQAGDAAGLGGKGIGIPASGKDRPSVVHVLPLRDGQLRSGLGSRAVAALFVAPATLPPRMPADAIAAIYDLTPAETSVFELLVAGRTQAEIAATLGIAPSTVKSHVLHLFAKTGCRRQANLVKLASSLSSPA